jgi:hypothetical protein
VSAVLQQLLTRPQSRSPGAVAGTDLVAERTKDEMRAGAEHTAKLERQGR